MAYTVPLRETLEKAGYKVTWQGEGKPIKIEKGGKTWDILPGAYEVREGKAYLDPTTVPGIMEKAGYVPLRKTFEGEGPATYRVDWYGEDRPVTVTSRETGLSYNVSPVYAGGTAYVPSEKVEEIKKYLSTPPEAKVSSDIQKMFSDYMTTVRQEADRYFQTMNQLAASYKDAGLAMLNAYQTQFKAALDTLKQLMEPQKEVPASVKLAIDILRKQTDENLQKLREEMNRRGIFQSGLAMEMERKLREGALTEEQKILANWLDKQHEQALKAAFSIANLYAQSAPQMAEMIYEAQTGPLSLLSNIAGKQYELATTLAGKQFDLLNELLKWQEEQKQKRLAEASKRELEQQKAQLEMWKTLFPYMYPKADTLLRIESQEQLTRERLATQERIAQLNADVRQAIAEGNWQLAIARLLELKDYHDRLLKLKEMELGLQGGQAQQGMGDLRALEANPTPGETFAEELSSLLQGLGLQ